MPRLCFNNPPNPSQSLHRRLTLEDSKFEIRYYDSAVVAYFLKLMTFFMFILPWPS